MKLFGIVALLAVSSFASASTSRTLHEDARTVAEILPHCPAEYRKAAKIAEHVSKIHYLSPRPANPKIMVESWTFSFTKDNHPANPNPKTNATLIVTRTTDNTGPLVPDQQGKITFHCKLFVSRQ